MDDIINVSQEIIKIAIVAVAALLVLVVALSG